MWNRLWTIGVKVLDLNRELEMHARLGNAVILDETVAFGGKSYRLPLLRVAGPERGVMRNDAKSVVSSNSERIALPL